MHRATPPRVGRFTAGAPPRYLCRPERPRVHPRLRPHLALEHQTRPRDPVGARRPPLASGQGNEWIASGCSQCERIYVAIIDTVICWVSSQNLCAP
jgi:hypothetical protein